VLVAEFAVCIVIAALSPLTDRHRQESAGVFMKRMSAVMGVFLILGLVSAMGRTPARLAAGVGGLMALALAVSERNLFTRMSTIFGSTTAGPVSGTGPGSDALNIGEQVGSDAGDLLGGLPIGG
jgi:hypothetical protein